MLKTFKPLIAIFLLSLVVLQLWLLSNLQLFGDEAFYWLEGQRIDWSYAELPGWTAWMIRLGTDVFGQHYFAVRIISYLNFIASFFAIYLIIKTIGAKFQATNLLLILAIPLYVLIALMALPDIWLINFILWITYFIISAVMSSSATKWFLAGVFIAISLNVHVRMWIWLFFAAIVFFVVFIKQKHIIKPALLITLPVALIGIIPIVIFNFNNDFALFDFQFGRRHPWQFQVSNISFLLSQFIVITPIILYVWFKTISQFSKQSPTVKWIMMTSLFHALFYVITSLFADGLRTTVHWLLASYIPVLIIAPNLNTVNKKILNTAIISGGFISLLLLLVFVFHKASNSPLQERLFDNSNGWQQLAIRIRQLQVKNKTKNIIADYFMTGAELAFELKDFQSLKVLSHKKNVKHGREKQLKIMGLLLTQPSKYQNHALLIVEDSTLKLQEKAKYYSKLCSSFEKIAYLETITNQNSRKQFHVFEINGLTQSLCQIPPLFYIEHRIEGDNIIISGWVIMDKIGIKQLSLISGDFIESITNDKRENLGIHKQFPEISDPNQPNNGFEIELPLSTFNSNHFRIKVVDNQKNSHFSQINYIK